MIERPCRASCLVDVQPSGRLSREFGRGVKTRGLHARFAVTRGLKRTLAREDSEEIGKGMKRGQTFEGVWRVGGDETRWEITSFWRRDVSRGMGRKPGSHLGEMNGALVTRMSMRMKLFVELVESPEDWH